MKEMLLMGTPDAEKYVCAAVKYLPGGWSAVSSTSVAWHLAQWLFHEYSGHLTTVCPARQLEIWHYAPWHYSTCLHLFVALVRLRMGKAPTMGMIMRLLEKCQPHKIDRKSSTVLALVFANGDTPKLGIKIWLWLWIHKQWDTRALDGHSFWTGYCAFTSVLCIYRSHHLVQRQNLLYFCQSFVYLWNELNVTESFKSDSVNSCRLSEDMTDHGLESCSLVPDRSMIPLSSSALCKPIVCIPVFRPLLIRLYET